MNRFARLAAAFSDPTALGLLAILIWSSTVAFSRRLALDLGPWTASACIYTGAGALACLLATRQPGGLRALSRLPRAYLWGCGALFIVYTVALYIAIGMAQTSAQVVVIGLINYLWPGLSLAFSVPILNKKARPYLPAGIAVALAGVALAAWQPGLPSEQAFSAGALGAYALALLAAVCWGLYSNLSRRWAAGGERGATPLFLLASGLCLALGRAFHPEASHWSLPTLLELLYMIVFPAMLAYSFWDQAVRRGRIILVATLSYFTPLLSTCLSVLLLGAPAPATLWLAALLVFAGAWVCKRAIPDE